MAAEAIVVWLAILLLPGFAILRLLRVPGPSHLLLGIAAPISFGLFYLVAIAASRLDLPVMPICWSTAAGLLLAWIVVEIVRLRLARADPASDRNTRRAEPAAHLALSARIRLRVSRSEPGTLLSLVLLIAALVAGVVFWRGLNAHVAVPAGWDAMHHGYFVRQIVAHDTLKASVVLSTDPSQADATTSFYPLAANLMTALLNVGSGIRISALMLASTVVLAGLILPLGVFALCRKLAPQLPLVAGFAAVASVLPGRLFGIAFSGLITAILGLALVPAAVAAVVYLGDRIDWRTAPLAVLSAIGVVGVHTSEMPVVAGLVVAVALVNAVLTHRWRAGALWLTYLAGIALLTVVVLLIADPGIRHLVGERSGSFISTNGRHIPLQNAIGQFLVLPTAPPSASLPMGLWSALAPVGCIISLSPPWRHLMAATLSYVAFGAFYVAWLSSRLGPLNFLTDMWYRDSSRMVWELLILGAIPVGITLAATATALSKAVAGLAHTTFRPRPAVELADPPPAGAADAATVGTRPSRVAVLVGVVVTTAFVGAFMLPPVSPVAYGLRSNSPVNTDAERAYAYLAAHVKPGQRVLDDLENHGDLWMYADYNVATLFGNPPLIGYAPASWKQRLYLRANLRNISTDGCVTRLLVQYKVAYVYFSDKTMYAGKPRIDLSTLGDGRYFQSVFRSNDSEIFKVQPLAKSGPCGANVTTVFPWSSLANSN